MKKLMVALTATALALGVQAAAISWQATGLVDSTGKTFDESSLFSTYTVKCTFWDATGNTVLITDDGSISSATGKASGQWKSPDSPVPSQNTSYYAQMVITDSKGSTLTSEKAAFTTDGSATYTINFATGSKFASETPKFDQTAANYGWAVPEPTSGLLLLLGVAGLALRRRRA